MPCTTTTLQLHRAAAPVNATLSTLFTDRLQMSSFQQADILHHCENQPNAHTFAAAMVPLAQLNCSTPTPQPSKRRRIHTCPTAIHQCNQCQVAFNSLQELHCHTTRTHQFQSITQVFNWFFAHRPSLYTSRNCDFLQLGESIFG